MTPLEAIQLMVQHKVVRLKHGELEIELSPLAFARDYQSSREISDALAGEFERCTCGHDESMHSGDNGMCLRGCDIDKCFGTGDTRPT